LIPPRFPELKPVGPEDGPLFRDFFTRFPSQACEMTFANVFIWRECERPKYAVHDDHLCILCAPADEAPFFLEPVGEGDMAATIEACLELNPRLSRVTELFAQRYGASYKVEADPNNFDYVYASEDLAQLKGKKYDGKRNRIRKFERTTASWDYRNLGPDTLDDCLALLEKWFNGKVLIDESVGAEKAAIVAALNGLRDLGLTGGAITIEGKVAAFSIGEPLNPDTAVIHIEIADHALPGLAQLINREFVRREWTRFAFINREQDVGHPGLRRAKESYQPHHMVRKYTIAR
jgi:uncharacterized protein